MTIVHCIEAIAVGIGISLIIIWLAVAIHRWK